MIIVTGSVQLTPEGRDEGFRLGTEHSQRSRAEPGCIAHNCYEDCETPGRMHFFEKWADLAALKAHFAVPESSAFVQQVAALAEAPPTIEIFTAEAVEFPPR
ncbi:putative quinol monooxygenase [Qipengyuania flava]|uniref:putative quinol monooxygenase n=1 Tax=Qipengyuania flava TaxID=192812 RepID=UPI001C63077B|nr:putative quinol monooxygenase [Qipengyuania flava]QYJ06041.1 antibiotic biosynthesis monooxygenase [Qipengyuania flava]